jgi:hypothetical protein
MGGPSEIRMGPYKVIFSTLPNSSVKSRYLSIGGKQRMPTITASGQLCITLPSVVPGLIFLLLFSFG